MNVLPSAPSAAPVAAARAAFLWACRMDVAVRKPGNVSLASAGHDMVAQQFLDSAAASAPALFTPGSRVGARVLGAVQATHAVAGCNTNLGILLLCAPIARALEHCGAVALTALRAALEQVLGALDVDDARAAYAAIALANPGGLGRSAEQDVSGEVTVNLRAAMALAAERDFIARQYANGYVEVFQALERHFPAPLDDAARRAAAAPQRVQQLFVDLLARHPDSHIVRKHGEASARAVQAQAVTWRERLQRRVEGVDETGFEAGFAAWDEQLKQAALNPGTSADLTVCVLFLAAVLGRVSLSPAQAPA